MDGTKQRKWGAVLSYVSIILNNSISILYTPFMLRMLGQSEYGLTGTASSYVSYLSLFSFGIAGAYIRYNTKYRAAGDKDGEEKLNGMFLIIFSVLSLLVFLGGTVLIIFSDYFLQGSFTKVEIERLRLIMLCMIINTVFTFVFTVVMMALQAYEEYIFLRVCSLATGIINPAINIVVLINGGKSVALACTSLIVSIIVFCVYFAYAYKKIKLRFQFCKYDKKVLKEILTFSGFLFINSLTDQLTFSTDNIILSKMYGTTAVAVYTVGSNFKNYFMNFSTSISSVFAPKINLLNAKGADNEELLDIMINVGRIQFIVTTLIILGYVSIGYDFIRLWAGKGYEDAYFIGLILMVAIYIPCFQNVGLEIQKAKNKHKIRSIVYFFVAIFNIIISIPLSKIAGGIGAAFATFMCMVVGNVLFMNWYYVRGIGLNMRRFWKNIISLLPSMVPASIVAYIIGVYIDINSYGGILMAAILIIVTYIIGLWFGGLNQTEKSMIHYR